MTSNNLTAATRPVLDFCTASNYACAVFDNKRIKCWGEGNAFGSSLNYGNSLGTVGDVIPYLDVGTSLQVVKVSCGYQHICMKFDTGSMKCLGLNDKGQIGLETPRSSISVGNGYVGDALPLVQLGNGLQVIDISLGRQHSCVLLTGNKVKCYGLNDAGQLGQGNSINIGASSSQMGNNLPLINFGVSVEIASVHSSSTANHNCAILLKPIAIAQRVKCWGLNSYNQLGYGDRNSKGDILRELGDNLPLVDLGLESKVKHLTIGKQTTCALLINNNIKCFGYGYNGELASGSTETILTTGDSISSMLIDAGKTVKFLSTGDSHSCIVYDDQTTMKCFGLNISGQLGQGDTNARGNTPTTMIPFIPAINLGTSELKIASTHCGFRSTCIVFENNSVKCFGYNGFGQLAIGSNLPVGDEPDEMGKNLKFAFLFSPTRSPTLPTHKPSRDPTRIPTKSPSTNPPVKSTPSPTNSTVPVKNENIPGDIMVGVGIGISIFLLLFIAMCVGVYVVYFDYELPCCETSCRKHTIESQPQPEPQLEQLQHSISFVGHTIYISFVDEDVQNESTPNVIERLEKEMKNLGATVVLSNKEKSFDDIELSIHRSALVFVAISENYFMRAHQLYEFHLASRNGNKMYLLKCEDMKFDVEKVVRFWTETDIGELTQRLGFDGMILDQRVRGIKEFAKEIVWNIESNDKKAQIIRNNDHDVDLIMADTANRLSNVAIPVYENLEIALQ